MEGDLSSQPGEQPPLARWRRPVRTLSNISQLACLDVTLQDGLKGEYSFGETELTEDPFAARHFVTSFAQAEFEQRSMDVVFSRSLTSEFRELANFLSRRDSRDSGRSSLAAGPAMPPSPPPAVTSRQADAEAVAGNVIINDLCTRLGLQHMKEDAVRMFQRCEAEQNNSRIQFKMEMQPLAAAALITTNQKWQDKPYAKALAKRKPRARDEPGSAPGPTGNGSNGSNDSALNSSKSSPTLTATATDIVQAAVRPGSSSLALTKPSIERHVQAIRGILETQPRVVEALRQSMYKCFRTLDLDHATSVLSAHIANEAVQQNLCQRRNSSSLSGAAVYLSCMLQGIKITQYEFCSRIGLTEVTLRKVHRELSAHWQDLVPQDYKPVQIPSSLAKYAKGRVSQTRRQEAELEAAPDPAAVAEANLAALFALAASSPTMAAVLGFQVAKAPAGTVPSRFAPGTNIPLMFTRQGAAVTRAQALEPLPLPPGILSGQ